MTDHDTPENEDGGRCDRSRGRRFRTSHVILALLAVIAATWLVGAALHAHEWRQGGLQETRYGGWHHGRDHGGMMERVCSERRSEWLDERIDLVESFVDFTPEQEPAWQALTAAVRSGGERVGEACGTIEEAGGGPSGRLARAEVMLETGLEIVRTVRPAFDDFYAVLDDNQKAALDRLMERRRGHD